MSRVGDDTMRSFNEPTRIRDPLLGQKIDDYEIQSLIGEGAMGIVYRAIHTVIGKPAAIKILRPDFAEDPDMVSRLIREARTVNAIRHPSIVDIFGFGQLKSTGQPYIVMDLLEGEPLDLYIREKAPVTFADAYGILDDLLGALAAAHAVGVIHRDLKPGNIVLEKQPEGRGRVKLLDFGLAKQADRANGSVRQTNPGTILGTPAFMAPEQVKGEKISPATDLYAVGGIAYQLLTGHLPHEGANAIEIVTAKLRTAPIRPKNWNPKIDEALDTWILALLHQDMALRPQSADEVRKSLKKLFDTRTTGSNPTHRPSSGNISNPGARPGAGGVVPKRQWNDAATVAADAQDSASSSTKTDGFTSPYEATRDHDAVPAPRPSASSEPTYTDESDGDGETPQAVRAVPPAPGAPPQASPPRPWESLRPAQLPVPPLDPPPNDTTPLASPAIDGSVKATLPVGNAEALAALSAATEAAAARPKSGSHPAQPLAQEPTKADLPQQAAGAEPDAAPATSKLPMVLVGLFVLAVIAFGIYALVK